MSRFIILGFLVLSLVNTGYAQQIDSVKAASTSKKYKRALVIAGGGLSPAVALGMIAGAKEMGWQPDVVITTCGSSMGSGVYNYFADTQKSLEYMKSQSFFNLMSLVKIQTDSVLDMKTKFDSLTNPVIPQLFEKNLLVMPETIDAKLLPAQTSAQLRDSKNLHFVMTSSKALFTKEMVGSPLTSAALFQQVYFTDEKTGQMLKNYPSPIKAAHPESMLSAKTAVITNQSALVAIRSAVADPNLLNPGKIGNDYYFTGAVDLFPVEMAHFLADEVLITYPESTFTDYEQLAIQSAFGFSQNDRLKNATKETNVKWIDITGISQVKMDPSNQFLTLVSNIPTDLNEFSAKIQDQYNFGRERAIEALKIQATNFNVRSHIRSLQNNNNGGFEQETRGGN